jgi:hypothetical protein
MKRRFVDILAPGAVGLALLVLAACAPTLAGPSSAAPGQAPGAMPSPTVNIATTAEPSPATAGPTGSATVEAQSVTVTAATAVPTSGPGSTPTGAAPVTTSGPSTSEPTVETLTVTLADDGKTLPLRPGQRFLLKLGEGYTWHVAIADPAIVSRVMGVIVIRGAQGLFEAHQPGATELTASGEPQCRQSQPPCALPSRLFRLQITVQ